MDNKSFNVPHFWLWAHHVFYLCPTIHFTPQYRWPDHRQPQSSLRHDIIASSNFKDKTFSTILAKSFGAGHAVSEMMTSDAKKYLYLPITKRCRYQFWGEFEIAPVSLRKSLAPDPEKNPHFSRSGSPSSCQWGANCRYQYGLPSKKKIVCCQKGRYQWSSHGSALLKDEDLVKDLDAPVNAVRCTVTLKPVWAI